MAVIGDADPLDAYDAADPAHVRLAILVRVVASLAHRTFERERRAEAVRLLRVLADELAG